MTTIQAPQRTDPAYSSFSVPFGSQFLREWPIILVLALLGGVAGALFGAGRPVTYTARVQLVVGPTASSPQALTGTQDNAVTIAQNYARAGRTSEVLQRASQALSLPVGTLRDDVTVMSVDGEAIVRVSAEEASERTALRVAGGYARTLRAAVAEQISPQRLGRTQLADYRAASASLVRARGDLSRLRGSGASQSELDNAEAALNTARLAVETAGNIYVSTRQQAQSITGLSPFDAARIQGDNGKDLLLRWTGAGVIAGALLGAALAVLLVQRRTRRLLRAS